MNVQQGKCKETFLDPAMILRGNVASYSSSKQARNKLERTGNECSMVSCLPFSPVLLNTILTVLKKSTKFY